MTAGVCARCSGPTKYFKSSNRYAKYCSAPCRDAANYAAHRHKYNLRDRSAYWQAPERKAADNARHHARYAKRRAAELGLTVEEWEARKWVHDVAKRRAPYKQRKLVACRCVICGGRFTARASNARYCSDTCRPYSRDSGWARSPSKKKPTVERGYGNEHQKRRRELLPKAYGTPCDLCGVVMQREDKLELDHSIPLALGGQKGDRITHASCNRRAGSRLGNQIRSGYVIRADDLAVEYPSLLLTSRDW